ncbi:PREDICTED: uncharacterized protein LOC105556239 [Vollenhovia emeryi]|uniref:uncharacterized protein LOC105556239 n=1 Tax=Vollenhovia emeryi TaxID=411798 RepID=UPI0005F47008|nr:PREDICTED: uncharacterized protein LOC105556239 [Vollenhovia emeryi]
MNLCYLAPIQTVLKKKANAPGWRPSRQEIQDGFITLIPDVSKLEETINSRNTKFQERKIIRQPFVIIVGADIDSILHSYVSVNDILYKFESPLRALEVSFKIFFVLNADYSIDSHPLWLLLQKAVYGINTKHDRAVSTMATQTLLDRFGLTL